MDPQAFPALAPLLAALPPWTFLALLPLLRAAEARRLARARFLAPSPRALRRAGRLEVLVLDEAGALRADGRMSVAFFPAPGVREEELAAAAAIASRGEESPEGRSIRASAEERCGPEGGAELPPRASTVEEASGLRGLDFQDGTPPLRKGPPEAIAAWIEGRGGELPGAVAAAAAYVVERGGTPLLVALGDRALGVLQLKPILREGLREGIFRLKRMGLRTILASGRKEAQASSIAAEAGIDEVLAEAGPEEVLARIRAEGAAGRLVACMGREAAEAPCLAEAGLGLAPLSGTAEAREAADIQSLEENPAKLLELAEIGRELRGTRSLLSAFALATDAARALLVLPALASLLSPLPEGGLPRPLLPLAEAALRGLLLPASGLCALLVLAFVLPLAFRGLRYRPAGSAALFGRSLLAYGLAGLLTPLLGIRLIELILGKL